MYQPTTDKQVLMRLMAIFTGVLIATAAIAYFMLGPAAGPAKLPLANPAAGSSAPDTGSATTDSAPAADASAAKGANRAGGDSVFAQLFGISDAATQSMHGDTWLTSVFKVMIHLAVAALLSALLAFRPRKFTVLFKRNLFVAQTQILLAAVASALMMVVGDSAARAFGIFAAVSLVRFRTNIKDPKEITVLLLSLAVGLATGVGRIDLAIVLTVFALGLLWALEYREQEMVTRAMELKVKTRSLIDTHAAVSRVLRRHGFGSELRVLDREDEKDKFAYVEFLVELGPTVSIDALSDEILASDHGQIDSIEWDQGKQAAVYQ
jgi:hypothetical protein